MSHIRDSLTAPGTLITAHLIQADVSLQQCWKACVPQAEASEQLLASPHLVTEQDCCHAAHLVILMPSLKWSSQLPPKSAACCGGLPADRPACPGVPADPCAASASASSSPWAPNSSRKRALFWMESARVSFCASWHSRVTTASAVLLMGSRISTCSPPCPHASARTSSTYFCGGQQARIALQKSKNTTSQKELQDATAC